MTQEIYNSHKINIYVKLNDFAQDIHTKSKYSIKDCKGDKNDLILASVLFNSIYSQTIDDTTGETYCLDSDELCSIITKIYDLI